MLAYYASDFTASPKQAGCVFTLMVDCDGRNAYQPTTCDSNNRRFLLSLLDHAEPGLAQRTVRGQQQRQSGVDRHHHADLGGESPGTGDVAVVDAVRSGSFEGQQFAFGVTDGHGVGEYGQSRLCWPKPHASSP